MIQKTQEWYLKVIKIPESVEIQVLDFSQYGVYLLKVLNGDVCLYLF